MGSSITGTATDYADYLTKLKNFLTADATLVAASQQWTLAWSGSGGTSTDFVLKGPGLAGGDNVFIGFRPINDVSNHKFSLLIFGMTGIVNAAARIEDHVNVSYPVGWYLDDNPMTYWFTASGRRFMTTTKISTVYETSYAGLFLPYADPTKYPYPLAIFGTRGATVPPLEDASWRSTSTGHTGLQALGDSQWLPTTLDRESPTGWVLDPTGVWLRPSGGIGTATNYSFAATNGGFALGPYSYGSQGSARIYTDLGVGLASPSNPNVQSYKTSDLDGNYGLEKITVVETCLANATLGILDECFYVPGFTNSSENVVTISGINYLVVQNCFRTEANQYLAMRISP